VLNLDIGKFAARIAEVEEAVVRWHHALPPLRLAPGDDGGIGQFPQGNPAMWAEVPVGGQYGDYERTVWLRGEIAFPSEWLGRAADLSVVLGDYRQIAGRILMGGPEALAYLDRVPAFGVDVRHPSQQITSSVQGTERHELLLEVFCGRVSEPHTLRQYELTARDAACAALAADLRTSYETLQLLDAESRDVVLLHRALNAALRRLDFAAPLSDAFYASCTPAREAFAAVLAGYVHGSRPQIVATGHAHIDTAWLWPVAQTRRKVARTWATALRLMEQYPEYHFTASQPQQYRYVKEDEPALYEQVKARIAEGRWEPTGAMWVEPDANVPRGESLVRQLVYGQRFFVEEFGRPASLVWLPDAFGYSWALPQLMRGAGVSHFLTSKISWNQFNRFPYDTFRWRGTDGSEVMAHFITTPDPSPKNRYFTYNGHMTAAEVAGTYRNYRQKEINDHLLYLFGWGDGGGGPTREMLEAGQRLGNLPGMPALLQGSGEEAFRQIEANATTPESADRYPVWHDELYFEYHRGTYTSQGRTKMAHRRAEYALHEAELWSSFAHVAAGAPVVSGALDEVWRLLLLQQFHDILPGSSIPVVYEDALRDLGTVQREADRAITNAMLALTSGMMGEANLLVAFNAAPVPHSGLVTLTLPSGFGYTDADGTPLDMQDLGPIPAFPQQHTYLLSPPPEGVPPHGYAAWALRQGNFEPPNALTATETLLENPFLRVMFDEHGQITSLVDKRRGDREVIAPGERGNRLIAFEDKPLNYDAWDIDIFYDEKPTPIDDVASVRVIESGPLRAGIEMVRHYLRSTVTQRVYLYRDIPRLDFVTDIDWQEHQILLKAAFPVDVLATHATYEIQFGTIERPTHANTSWDAARFEVCGQRWADLSEGGYGVALLNNGKYGYDVRGHTLSLTLLKSGINPDPNADIGRHRFTYSLLPHAGNWREGEVIAHAAMLNQPLRTVGRMAEPTRSPASFPRRQSFVTCDRPGVFVDTIKPADDGQGFIVRLYEGHGSRGTASMQFAHPLLTAEECNLLERRIGGAATPDLYTLAFAVRPYEVKTFRVRFDG